MEEEKPMYRRWYIPSLERLCLEYVARNLEHVWDKDFMDNCLAEKFVPSLISISKGTKRLTAKVLDLLLVSHLMTLDLKYCPELVLNQDLLQTIGMRCKKLTVLNLTACDQIPAANLVDLVKGVPCLIKLDLSKTRCDTRVLFTLASCCRRLRELAIAECRSLADDSLLYLAYDPLSHSFCSPELQSLKANRLKSRIPNDYETRALAFVMLALPSLTFVWHDLFTEAVFLIYWQAFDDAQLLPGFPSLKEVASGRAATGTKNECSRPILALRRVRDVHDSEIPEVIDLCPHLASVQMLLGNYPLWNQRILSCRYLTHLDLSCRTKRDLGELLHMTAILGPQLVTLSISGFSLIDPFSFPTLLRQCVNLKDFSALLVSHMEGVHGSQPDNEAAMDWDFDLCPLVFPQLSDFSLGYYDLENPLPFLHGLVLEKCIVSLMKLSPSLRNLVLVNLPFSLEVVFQEVLKCPRNSLLNLSKLTFDLAQLTMPTVDLLLSSNVCLSCITLYTEQNVSMAKYKKILKKIKRNGIEVKIPVDLD